MLSDQQRDTFTRDGVLFPLPVLSASEVRRYRSACDDLELQLGGRPKPVELNQTHLNFPWACELTVHPRILDAVEQLIGPDVIAWAASIFPKHPHDPAFISWHQDGKYWQLDSDQVVTAWVALSESNPANGCMRVVVGSHRQEYLAHVDTHAENNLLSRGQEVAVDVDEADATAVLLRPGEMSLHHVRIVHGSNPNRSDDKRVGFAIRYVTPAVQQTGQRPAALLARGSDDFGHYELISRPPDRPLAEAIAAHRESSRRLLETVTTTTG